MKAKDNDMAKATEAFLILGEMKMELSKMDNKQRDAAIKTLDEICVRNKMTLDQLSTQVLSAAKKVMS